jgi:hypothetical protein
VREDGGWSCSDCTKLSDDRLRPLQEMSGCLQVAPGELVRASIADLLVRPEEEFRNVLEHVLQ